MAMQNNFAAAADENIINNQTHESFERLDKLGEGTYGIVYKVRHRVNHKLYAMKVIRIEDGEEGIGQTSLREISALLELRSHPNIVKLLSILTNDRKLSLVFEYLDFDLRRYIDNFQKQHRNGAGPGNQLPPGVSLGREKIVSFTIQILCALFYAHQRRIMHRDLKPQNILVDATGTHLKLADFGLARSFGVPIRQYTHEIVTLWYRAPEVLLGVQRYGVEVDIWSVGTILAEMVNLTALLPGDSEIDQLFRIFRMFGTPTNETWPGVESCKDYKPMFPRWQAAPLQNCITRMRDPLLLDLLQKMFVLDPAHRISTYDALLHPFLSPVTSGAVPVLPTSPLAALVPLPSMDVIRGQPLPLVAN